MKSILPLRLRILLLLVVAAPFYFAGLNAKADLVTTFPEMGDLLRWGVFSLGGGVSGDSDEMTGTTDIYGDVGVAGNGNITMTGNSTIHGDLYYRTNGTLKMKGAARITGTKHHDAGSDAQLDNGVTEAINTSNHAFALPVTRPQYTSITSSTMITGAPGETVVLKLTNFTLNHGTLTLRGSANTTFVINVTNQFSLGSHSQIVLSGGVQWDDVLFNVRGSGTVSLDSQSTLRGVLMANNRTVNMDGQASVQGEVIANKISMKGGSQVVHPPLSSP